MLHPLDLKLLRDIGRMKGQMLSVSVVMACGLAMMVMSRSLILSLESTRDAYYTGHRFADVFCDLKRAVGDDVGGTADSPGQRIVRHPIAHVLASELPERKGTEKPG